MKVARMLVPEVQATGGPRSCRFEAFDPNTFDVCGDSTCKCRQAKGNIRGFGETEEAALADFWEKYLEASEPEVHLDAGDL
jgi:hypothetical protein